MALFTRDVKNPLGKKEISFVTGESIDWKVLKIEYDEFSFRYDFVDLVEYTYIMSDDLNSTFKIGRTTNKPTDRLTNLRTANPNISMSMVFPFQEFSENSLWHASCPSHYPYAISPDQRCHSAKLTTVSHLPGQFSSSKHTHRLGCNVQPHS